MDFNRQIYDQFATQKSFATGLSRSAQLQVNNSMKRVVLSHEFGEVANYTVQFNIDPPEPEVSGARARGRAEILWKIGGTWVRREAHVSDGTALTGTAEAVSVSLADDTQVAIAGQPLYDATINVSRGTRGASTTPPFLQLATVVVAPGATAQIPVPSDVGANSIMVLAMGDNLNTVITEGQISVMQLDGAGVVYDPLHPLWVPLAPGVGAILCRVSNVAAGDVRFTVFLGIEG